LPRVRTCGQGPQSSFSAATVRFSMSRRSGAATGRRRKLTEPKPFFDPGAGADKSAWLGVFDLVPPPRRRWFER